MGCSRECFPVSSTGEFGRKFRYEKFFIIVIRGLVSVLLHRCGEWKRMVGFINLVD